MRLAKNYYAILGLGCDATPDEIKAAYRRKAHELHPDHSGTDGRPFLDVQEAYEAPSDPARRRAYDDRQAAGQSRRSAFGAVQPEPLQPRRCPVEPLIPGAGEWAGSPLSARPFYGPLEPSAGGILDALLGDWEPLIRPRIASRHEAHLDVRLNMEQAAHGGRLRLWIPVQVRCLACWGQGGVGLDECWECSGTGEITEERAVSISFPPGLTENCTACIAGEQVGMRGVDLVLHVRVR